MSLVAAVALTALVSLQQPPPPRPFTTPTNPISDALRDRLGRDLKSLVTSAELMPADKYGYHPTPAQMTFGALIVHVVQTNVALCSAISNVAVAEARFPSLPMTQLGKLSETLGKEALVGAIKQSFDYCTEALAKLDDTHLAEEALMFGRATGLARGTAIVTLAADWADHYSTAASYLRMNGVLPPTAQPAK